jgi:hypothetical protein
VLHNFMNNPGIDGPLQINLQQHAGQFLESVPVDEVEYYAVNIKFVGIADQFGEPQTADAKAIGHDFHVMIADAVEQLLLIGNSGCLVWLDPVST